MIEIKRDVHVGIVRVLAIALTYNEMTGSCRWYEREDGTDVIFRKVEQVVTV